MDISDEIADYLEDSGFGTVGTDIFVEQIPADQNGLYVSEIGSIPYKYLPMEEAAIDIYSKHVKSETAKSNLKDVKDHLHRMHTTSTTNTFIFSILAIGAVENLGRDLENNNLYKLSISVIYRDTGLIS